MPLFQPTNITPSTFGGVGNGTIDATLPLQVSWQVNGNVAMTAFSITIYENDEASTQLFSTGQRSDNCPFYGVSYPFSQANTMFSYTIPASQLSGAGITNGNEYKLIIQQWWGSGDGESITQTSASVFITRETPSVSIDFFNTPIAEKNYTFTATYEQAQGDPLLWGRWQIATANDTDNPLLDTNNIYNATELTVSYDGFFTGTTYSIRCLIETVNGQQADTGWQEFQVQYASESISGFVSACQLKNISGVLVTWPKFNYIAGSATGLYSAYPQRLNLPSNTSISWNSVTGSPMSFGPPWTVISQFTLTSVNDNVFQIETGAGTIAVALVSAELIVSLDSAELCNIPLPVSMPSTVTIRMVLQPSRIDVRISPKSGGLYPSSTLYPSTSLYPMAEQETTPTISGAAFLSPVNSPISAIQINGGATFNYIWVETSSLAAADISSILQPQVYTPTPDWTSSTAFYTDFSNGINAGNTPPLNIEITGFSIYRLGAGQGALTHIYDVALEDDSIIDYGVASQSTYTYYVFATGDNTYATSPLVSSPITPLFWDWAVLECEQDESGAYHVLNQYLFGKNLTSGAISNNNTPNLLQNFTPYPLIQPVSTLYASGALTSYIGTVTKGVYSDTIQARNAIMQLSVSQNTMFLKSRKGDVWQIRPSGPITATTWDNAVEQAQNISFPWAEVADSTNAVIIALPTSTT